MSIDLPLETAIAGNQASSVPASLPMDHDRSVVCDIQTRKIKSMIGNGNPSASIGYSRNNREQNEWMVEIKAELR